MRTIITIAMLSISSTFVGCSHIYQPKTEQKEVAAVAVQDLPEPASAPLIEAGWKPEELVALSSVPEQYLPEIDPDKVQRAVMPVETGEYEPSSYVNAVVAGVNAVPGLEWAAALLGTSLAAGAGYLKKRADGQKRSYEAALEAIAENIDGFRDVLDQTPQGEKIDAALQEWLRKAPTEEIRTIILGILQRKETPTKTPIAI